MSSVPPQGPSFSAIHMNDAQNLLADLTAWRSISTAQAKLTLSRATSAPVGSIQMTFDFGGSGGYVIARRELVRTMSEDFAVHFQLRGRAPANHLELKLVDPTGLNVWRHVIRDLKPPAEWQEFTLESRDIDFAWGPAGGGAIAELGAIEFAIVAGEGGAGYLSISELSIEDRQAPAVRTAWASSEMPGFEAKKVPGGDIWRPCAGDAHPSITLDLGADRQIGGMVIDWLAHAPTRGFRILGSADGDRWELLHAASKAAGKSSQIYLPGARAHFLRLDMDEPSDGAMLRVKSFEYSRSVDAFWHNVAKAAPRGWYPRWLYREQSLWTPIGTSNGAPCALINEEGMVEVFPGSFSIEPMLWVNGRLFTWADVSPTQGLRNGWMPFPSVVWESGDWRLSIQGEVTKSGTLQVRYRAESISNGSCEGRLFVVVRPFQVTPPWQRFHDLGGFRPVNDIAQCDGVVRINGKESIVPMVPHFEFGAAAFDEGVVTEYLAKGQLPANAGVHDTHGFASAVLAFDLSSRDKGHCEVVLACTSDVTEISSRAALFDWDSKLPASQWMGEGWAGDVVRSALTAAAHVLVNRNGAALQPGPRRYTRSWIRDGAVMGAALLRMGCFEEVRDFIRWYAPNQRADGFVPCCVDGDGPDWLIEHDSHGEFIALVADYHGFTADIESLKESWIYVDKAVGCIERLLGKDGLLPISASHEGYLAQPVHSYWDDFWALRGLLDAVKLARALGRDEKERAWTSLSVRFATSLYASIEKTRREHNLDYIPCSVEWADFDPTSTASAIGLLGVPEGIDRQALERTFTLHMSQWRGKRSGSISAPNYTPYEIRVIGALVRLGRRDEALELLRFYLSDRRPPAWNQWPEIAWRDHRAPAHLGDLPHAWVGAEYVLAVRSLFAYESEHDHKMVVAAGLAPEWIEGAGVKVERMPTLYGSLSYSLRKLDRETLEFAIGGGLSSGIVLRPPLAESLQSVTLDGRSLTSFDRDSVYIPSGEATVICKLGSAVGR